MRFLLILLFVPFSAFAAEADVQRISDGTRIEQMLNAAQSRATADLTERGTTMELTYSSPAPLDVLVLFLHANGLFDPLESLVVTLPEGTRNTVHIDLTGSAGWTPFERTYRLHFLSRSAEGASFEDIEFTGDSLVATAIAAAKQLVLPLPYTPSSYHRIPSYTVIGIPIIPTVGVLLIVITLLLTRKRPRIALTLIICITVVLQARYSLDLLRYAVAHTSEWYTKHTYATAGSLPRIGTDLQKDDSTGVYLCHTGTSYAKRVLAYHAYPVLITEESPSHAVVHSSTDWSYERGVLRCGSKSFRAREQHEYTDGSLLFTVSNL